MRKRWAKDAEKVGHTTCPECKRLLQYGPGGVVNLHKTHLGTQVCIDYKKSANPHSLLCLRLGYYAPKSGRDHWQVFYPAGSDSAGIYYQSPESNIYALLKDLPLMSFWVGADDLLPDKDPKHVFKRLRNRHLRKGGMDHIHALFNPEDKQDVKLAFDFLKDIWSLPLLFDETRPGVVSTREALHTSGTLFYHLIFPYICVDLTLSKQLEHTSLPLCLEDQSGDIATVLTL
ncbi:hypothetical protein C8R44DRAFT_890147 [Mycena epipterygia]|nr:hypothetical protein C8R44DRAFT_890147 [Mycena epipterygia]